MSIKKKHFYGITNRDSLHYETFYFSGFRVCVSEDTSSWCNRGRSRWN